MYPSSVIANPVPWDRGNRLHNRGNNRFPLPLFVISLPLFEGIYHELTEHQLSESFEPDS